MYKLLIADRDRQELAGLEWLITKYSFPITDTILADQLVNIFNILENQQPDIFCIELDMIPEDKWEMVQTFIERYAGQVIAVTAEPTFERAMQAMDMEAVDLWVKPLSPSRVKHSLQQTFRNLSKQTTRNPANELKQAIRYESLFIDDGLPFQHPVYLIKTEHVADLNDLRSFIEQFDFYYTPLVFSTSDRLALVFQESFPEPVKQAQRFLQEWERFAGKPLAIVVHAEQGSDSLHQIYMKLRKIMETTFFTGYQQVLSSFHHHEWEDMDPFLTMNEQRNWVYMLDEGQGDEIKKWMYEQFFSMEPPFPDPGLLRTRLTSILAQVRRFMIRKGITDPASEEKYKAVFDTILYSPVLYRIVQDMILYMNGLLQSIAEKPATTKIDVIEEAIAYMEDHFEDSSLSLKEVAEHVKRSPSYFSHILSHKYRRSFREMLSYIRVQKAKEMLASSDETIYHIAHSVGFRNPNYFSRVFKATTGQTPREYRMYH
ncbi:helix-turn-helix domain-containing protein [Halobacillus naozhouensis]|uniref:Helix-turn-helix domain-containing protein n=1 Tax=Halobacillus naozhouensis TaxID=554880 RepID=A0ABY8IX35_9BACI|nr:helix-turn-helix domain-containing protein [Halobacillus naozhouensis]WFT74793.1 helix-turn-helix domain-containing protein [Halobacillus naozhouensis]